MAPVAVASLYRETCAEKRGDDHLGFTWGQKNGATDNLPFGKK
jgi:hypothetical protein